MAGLLNGPSREAGRTSRSGHAGDGFGTTPSTHLSTGRSSIHLFSARLLCLCSHACDSLSLSRALASRRRKQSTYYPNTSFQPTSRVRGFQLVHPQTLSLTRLSASFLFILVVRLGGDHSANHPYTLQQNPALSMRAWAPSVVSSYLCLYLAARCYAPFSRGASGAPLFSSVPLLSHCLRPCRRLISI